MNPTDTPDDDPYDGLPPQSPEEEATMQREIDLLMEPYRKIAPASLLPVMREKLEHALRTQAYPRQLIKAFAQRTSKGTSGEAAIDGSTEPVEKPGGKEGA